MRVFYAIAVCVGIVLTLGGAPAFASDDNPWRMDTPRDSRKITPPGEFGRNPNNPVWGARGQKQAVQPSYEDSNQGVRGDNSRRQQPAVPAQNDEFDRGRLNNDFGYAGTGQDGRHGSERDPNRAHYGEFPPPDGEERFEAGRDAGGVKFQGRYYGAFPPLVKKPAALDRQQWRDEAGRETGDQRQGTSTFTNVPPPPVPEPLPEGAYPSPGYGMPPGFGTGPYGMPYNPLMMGLWDPGLTW